MAFSRIRSASEDAGGKRGRIFMRTTALRVTCLGLIVAGSGLIVASAKATGGQHEQNHSCSQATLKGFYTFSAVGSTETNGVTTNLAVAGYEIFDGKGNFTGVVSASQGGVNSGIGPTTGSYTLNPDCSGTQTTVLSDGTALQFDIFAQPSGAEFQWIEIDPGSTLAGSEIRNEERRRDE
jgi:hypothetical protein